MNDILSMHQKLRDLILLSGVNADHYEGLLEIARFHVPDDDPIKQDIFDAYSALEQGSWREARRIRELLPETVWRMYTNLPEMQEAREVVALRAELLKLKSNYYSLFKEIRRGLRKKKKAADKDSTTTVIESVPH
jgi:hypothetical protein